MTSEQKAREKIDAMLNASGWAVQEINKVNFNAGPGIVIREYQTDAGPADYILFFKRKPIGIIEAKKEEEGFRLTVVEDQASEYATSKLKYLNNDPLPSVMKALAQLLVLQTMVIRNHVRDQCLLFTDRRLLMNG